MSFYDKLRKLGFDSYQDYLKSEHWLDVRKRFWASKLGAKKRCAGCLRKDVPLQLHHRTYRRIGAEKLGDLVQVCGECHAAIHDREKNNRGRMNLWGATKRTLRRKRKAALTG